MSVDTCNHSDNLDQHLFRLTMSLWRTAGLTYLHYSQIASAVTRQCSKVTI